MNIFKRWNKNAKNKPDITFDFITETARKAEKDATTLSCINAIANSIAGLSVGVYSSKTKEKVENHPINDLLKMPNIEEMHTLFFNQLIWDYFSGNIFIKLWRDNESGEIISMFRINPANVEVYRNTNNKKNYKVSEAGGCRIYDDRQILHIPAPFNYDGLIGHSIFEIASKTFSTAENLDSYTDRAFNNNIGKRLVIDVSNARADATPEQQQEIIKRFIQNYSGVENAAKPILKKAGVNFETIDTGITDNRSSQLEENRKFTQEIITQLFGIPLEYLNGSGAGDIEKITTMYVNNAILPIINTLEEYFIKLFKIEDRSKYFIKFNLKSLLKTSLVNQIQSYSTQLNNGMLSVNEIRKFEGLPAIDAGDYLYRNSALLPIREDIEASLAASSKLKMQELQQNATGEQVNGDAKNIGSDKL